MKILNAETPSREKQGSVSKQEKLMLKDLTESIRQRLQNLKLQPEVALEQDNEQDGGLKSQQLTVMKLKKQS
jgi:hypothetical protein